ncbi:LysE family translocator [Spirillospora sp. CA-294931]|uniref:LysE family translocator n=1 Tax=Spirillospora sp. CA-294931 TaxID=3240042 RepID=UPI003D927BA2
MLIDPGVAAAFCLAALVMALVPGPDLLFIAATGLASGRRAGVLAALGMAAGLAVHTTAAAFGLGALLQAFPTAFNVIRILGAIYLVWLAISSFRAAGAPELLEPQQLERAYSPRRIFTRALLTNLANPKVIAFYLAFFPQFINPSQGHTTAQFFILGVLFIAVGLCVDATAGLLAGNLGDFARRRPAFQKWLHRLSGTIFAGLAVRLAADTR